MKAGVLGAAVLVLGAVGYFGYEEWEKRKRDKQREEEAIAEREEAALRNRPKAEKPKAPKKRVPDLFGQTPDSARMMLKNAGFSPDQLVILDSNYICRYANERDMVDQGSICKQEPQPELEVEITRKIEVTIEHDTFERGALGSPNEWRRMPDLIGMTRAEVEPALRAAGFEMSEFRIDEQQGCSVNAVCDTTPPPSGRKVKAREGVITIGRP